jgi:hypothetical protein
LEQLAWCDAEDVSEAPQLFWSGNESPSFGERDDRLRHAGDGLNRLLTESSSLSFEFEALDGMHENLQWFSQHPFRCGIAAGHPLLRVRLEALLLLLPNPPQAFRYNIGAFSAVASWLLFLSKTSSLEVNIAREATQGPAGRAPCPQPQGGPAGAGRGRNVGPAG